MHTETGAVPSGDPEVQGWSGDPQPRVRSTLNSPNHDAPSLQIPVPTQFCFVPSPLLLLISLFFLKAISMMVDEARWCRHPAQPRARRVPRADAQRRGRSRPPPPPRSKMAGGPKMVLSMRRHLQGWSHARRGLFMQRGIN